MTRSGYIDDGWEDAEGQWKLIRWRGAVKAAIQGKRGQSFLREMLAAMDALPEKKLIAGTLVTPDGCACALGTVALVRGIEIPQPDPDADEYELEEFWEHNMPDFGIANAMQREIMYENDEGGRHDETPEQRFARMRRWIERHLIEPTC